MISTICHARCNYTVASHNNPLVVIPPYAGDVAEAMSYHLSLHHTAAMTTSKLVNVIENACYTTVDDEESPGEANRLASALQFAEFDSVIGTMWAVGDAHMGQGTLVFYKQIMDEPGHLDHARAALALSKTMR